jgi:hypothetical protein
MVKEEANARKKKKKKHIDTDIYIKLSSEDIAEDEDHSVSILLSLLINTAPDLDQQSDVIHDRVLFKFMENNFEKLQRLIELH